jgi:hypothetical protein
MTNITYVFEDTEVKMTGRKAIREFHTTALKSRAVKQEVFEITPIDGINDWKKWVKQTDLFEIVG